MQNVSLLSSLVRRVKRAAKGMIRAAGYELRSTRECKPVSPGIRHAEVIPAATYSPWLEDEHFKNIHNVIRHNTLVDLYRCYELWQLTIEAGKLAAGDVIEIGVWRGGTGALIAKGCQVAGIESTV